MKTGCKGTRENGGIKKRSSKIHGEGQEWTARERWKNAFSRNQRKINQEQSRSRRDRILRKIAVTIPEGARCR